VAAEAFAGLAVGIQQRRVGVGGMLFQPAEQRRAEVEADLLVVVDDPADVPGGI